MVWVAEVKGNFFSFKPFSVKIRLDILSITLLALAAWLFVSGCERSDTSAFIAESDEAGYRRGKELLRQGRNQEALTEFQKVIEKRGLNNAPEAHLELGLLYQHHIRDPIAAIYHYRRFRELKPNSPQSDLVRQQIDACTREFARTLPAQPMDNMERYDMTDVVQRLQRENEQLKSELARQRASAFAKAAPENDALSLTDDPMTETSGPAYAANVPEPSPVGRPSVDANLPPVNQSVNPLPTRPGVVASQPAPIRPTRTATAPAGTGRKHLVVKGDTLMSLAQRYYGNRSRWRDIAEANREQLKGKNDLQIGMELKLPQ